MEINFKYEIGQFVYSRQDLRRWREQFGHVEQMSKARGYESMGELTTRDRKPAAIQVIERHMQQCYGGIQLHYHFRSAAAIITVTENELTDDFNDPTIGALNVVA